MTLASVSPCTLVKIKATVDALKTGSVAPGPPSLVVSGPLQPATRACPHGGQPWCLTLPSGLSTLHPPADVPPREPRSDLRTGPGMSTPGQGLATGSICTESCWCQVATGEGRG